MPMVRANGIDLYYEVSGGGPAILGIHGTPSSAVLWEAAAQKLAGLGRCIIYDRRGFGRSERPVPFNATDLSEHVDDAVALIDKLGATPATIIGRSTGGLIALALAHHYPEIVRALVLLEPAFFTIDPEAATWADALRRRILEAAEDDPESASEFVIREAMGVETWNSLPDDSRALFAAASPAVLAEMRGQGLDLSEHPLQLRSDQIASISQPTLLISAKDSPDALRRVNAGLAAILPHVDHVLVAGGHLIDPAHPHVMEFLSGVLGPAH